MKAGDLVKHDPAGKASGELKHIFEDWGWMPDFSSGIILEVRGDHALVHCLDDNVSSPYFKTEWYELSQLRSLNDSR